MESIGESLKNRRTERGFNLAEVHDSTKIATQTLAALEENRFDAFPNRVYARAFLRDYANFLKLDSSEMLQRYEEEWGGEPAPPKRRSRWPAVVGMALLVLVLAGFGYATYYYSTRGAQQAAPEQRPAVKAEKPAPTPAPAPKPAPAVAPAKPEPPANETPAPAEKPAPPIAAIKNVRVELQTKSKPVWVRVKKDGVKEFEGMLAPGTRASFVGKKEVFVRAGDAGGLQVTVNGKDMGRFGPSGQPANRTFTLDPPTR